MEQKCVACLALSCPLIAQLGCPLQLPVGSRGWPVQASDKGGTWLIGLLVAAAAGGLLALLYAFFAIHLRADQIVGGTGVNFLALGLTGFFFVQLYNNAPVQNGVSLIPNVNFLSGSHFFGAAIGGLSILTWAGFVLVILTYIVLFKTPIGLRIRACGEHPRAADTVGIDVYAIRYACVVLSGILAALGGVYLSIGPQANGTFIFNITDGKGFIALAAVIFGRWDPMRAALACLFFAAAETLQIQLQGTQGIPSQFIQMLPYVLTIVALAGVVGRAIPPASLGKAE